MTRSSSTRRGVRAIVPPRSTIIGGLGSAVLEALRRERHAPVEMVGVQDRFGPSAENYEMLLAHYGLTTQAVTEAVRRLLATA